VNRLAASLYRWSIPLSAALVIGAIALIPRASVTAVDNDISAWFSRSDPLFRDYDRFQAEFGGTQPLIIALRSETPAPAAPAAGLFTRERLELVKEMTGDISLRTGTFLFRLDNHVPRA
jgi:predicted RND superfamily exporter protein